MNKRLSKAERFESGEGHLCGIAWGPIIAAAVGGGLGLLGSERQTDAMQDAQREANAANADAGKPLWDPEQRKYVFGQGYNFKVPEINAAALNYGQGLMGGYNPAYGPQGPMNYDDLLNSIAGAGESEGTTDPWYQNPNSSTQASGNPGGMRGLLGYDAGPPPPLFMNSPYFGQGVADPENLMQPPGGTGAVDALAQDPAGPQTPQAPQQSAPPPQAPQLPVWDQSQRYAAQQFGMAQGATPSRGGVDPFMRHYSSGGDPSRGIMTSQGFIANPNGPGSRMQQDQAYQMYQMGLG